MNNKGWGISTLIGFLAIFGIFFIVAAVLYNKNFSDINDIVEEEKKEEKIKEEIEETVQEEYRNTDSKEEIQAIDYEKLENNLKESAQKYIDQKKLISDYKTIITYDNIKHENLITDFIDPKTGNTCNGYVIYYNNELNPFVRCIGSYQTSNYDEELE